MNYTEGTQVLDGWTIIRKLGSGSFGTVYQIERKDEYGICERSALKVISVPQSPEDMKEILDEGMNDREASTYFNSVMRDIVREIAVMVETKSCEHIVRYEAHKVIAHENGIGGDILIRMELLTSLPEYRRTHEMNENDVIRMGRDLADALTYCERKGLIHRDIKPQNIFVTENGSFKLGDFGIARRMQRTTGASRKGTEDYMAPEVYLRRHYGTTVDIYSLGLVMYKYMNCGRLPFLPLPPTPPSFDDREQALQNRMNGVPLPPSAEAGEGLSAIILKACAYDSAQRYRNAGELKADLDALSVSDRGTIGSTEDDAVDTRDTVDNTEEEKIENIEGTIGGWPLGEKPPVAEKINIEKEDDRHKKLEKENTQQPKTEVTHTSMFEKQSVMNVMLKKTCIGALPVWIFAMSCFTNLFLSSYIYSNNWIICESIWDESIWDTAILQNSLLIIVMAAANLFGMKGASAWRKKISLVNMEKPSQAKKEENVRRTYIIGSIGVGIALIFILPSIITNWLKFFDDIESVRSYINIYTYTASLASPFIMVSGMLSKILIVKGMRKRAAMGLMIGNVVNIVLSVSTFFLSDYVQNYDLRFFTYAISFVISSLIATVYYVICFAKTRSKSMEKPDYTESYLKQIDSTITAGLPTALSVLGVGIFMPFFASEIYVFGFLLGIGMGHGVQSVIRDCLETGDKKQYQKAMRSAFVTAMIVAISFNILYLCLSQVTRGIITLNGPRALLITLEQILWIILICITYILINTLYAMKEKLAIIIVILYLCKTVVCIMFGIVPYYYVMELMVDFLIVLLAAILLRRCSKQFWAKQKSKQKS